MAMVYKICSGGEWQTAVRDGCYTGSAVDQTDGFIHLSAADQVAGTAARHFTGQTGLVIVEYAEEDLPGLTWEASRGGALFPHVYGSLPAAKARRVAELPVAEGRHVLPWGLPQ